MAEHDPAAQQRPDRGGAEVLVLGAGPAGATAALQLARRGHRVRLVERGDGAPGERGAAHVAEALPPALRPLLGSLGVLDDIDAAGFLRPSPPHVDWPGLPERFDATDAATTDGRPGWLVDRTRMAALLRGAAARTGVEMLQGRAGAAERHGARWQVDVRRPSGERTVLSADMVLDARGRRGGAGQPATVARTVALLALWRPGAASTTVEPCMRVQAVRRGWVWFAPLSDGAVNVGVFVDAGEVQGLGAGERNALYRARLAEATRLAPRLQGYQPGPLRSTDASARCVTDAVPQDGLLLVGDAAVALDPLSSQGVQAALRSAVQAAACVHTAWHRPLDAALAWQFHRRQSADLATRHARWGAALHAAPAERWDEVFWHRRRSPGLASQPVVDAPPAARAWPGLRDRLALQSGVRLASAPVLEGDWVVGRPVLQADQGGRGAAYVAGVPVADWLAPLGRQPAPRLAELLDEWRSRFGADRTQAAFSHLWQQRLLCRADS